MLNVAHACYSDLPAEQGLARHMALIALELLLLPLLELTDDADDGDDTVPTICRSFEFVRHEKYTFQKTATVCANST